MPLFAHSIRDCYFSLKTEINLLKINPHMPRADTRRTISTYEHPGAYRRSVGKMCACPFLVLADTSHT